MQPKLSALNWVTVEMWTQHLKCAQRKVSDKEQSCRVSFRSCRGSLVCWALHRAAWRGLNNTQSSKRMTGRGLCWPAHPGSLFVAWLLLQKAQQVATWRRGGWSPAFPPELQSFCLVPGFCAVALPRARTSRSVSGKQRDRSSHVWCQSNSFQDGERGWKNGAQKHHDSTSTLHIAPLKALLVRSSLFNCYRLKKILIFLEQSLWWSQSHLDFQHLNVYEICAFPPVLGSCVYVCCLYSDFNDSAKIHHSIQWMSNNQR